VYSFSRTEPTSFHSSPLAMVIVIWERIGLKSFALRWAISAPDPSLMVTSFGMPIRLPRIR